LNCYGVKLFEKVANLIEFLLITGIIGKDSDIEVGYRDGISVRERK